MPNALALRPRSAMEIIDAAFQLLRTDYGNFVAISGVVFFPVIALRLILPEEAASFPRLLQNLLISVAQGAIMLAASERYLGRPIVLGMCLARAYRRWWSLFVVGFCQGLLIVIGLVLFVIPGLWAFAALFAAPLIVVLEGADVGTALGRSRELTRGSIARILGIAGLTFLVFLVLSIGVGIAFGLLMSHQSPKTTDVVAVFTMILLYPLVGIVATLLYYDLRIRREGFDLEMMAEELTTGRSTTGATAAAGSG